MPLVLCRAASQVSRSPLASCSGSSTSRIFKLRDPPLRAHLTTNRTPGIPLNRSCRASYLLFEVGAAHHGVELKAGAYLEAYQE